MKPELGPLERPIAILVDYIASENTTIHVKQHDGQISGSNFTVSDHDPQTTSATSPSKLFTVEGKLLALDLRRTFRDPKGTPMFDLYRKPFGYTWWIDLPTEGCRLQSAVVRLAPRWNNFKDKLYIEGLNAAADGQEVRLEALGQDIHKLRTNVVLGDKVVMTAKRSDKMSAYLFGMWKRPEWIVDVAQGMDISLVSPSERFPELTTDADETTAGSSHHGGVGRHDV